MFTIEETGCCFLQEEGTLKPYPRFNAEEDVQKLRKAMKGFGKWDLFYHNAKKVGENSHFSQEYSYKSGSPFSSRLNTQGS